MFHLDLQERKEEKCKGTMSRYPVYEAGQLINCIWYCEDCGASYTEYEIVRSIENRGSEHGQA